MTAAAAAIDPARHIGLARLFAQPLARRNPALADDLHAAALLGVVEACRTFDPAEGKFSVWALFHCRREFTRLLRLERPRGYRAAHLKPPRTVSLAAPIRASGRGGLPPIPLSRAIADPRDPFAPAAAEDAFERLLRGVTPRQAAALRLAFVEGLTHEEAAARLGVSQQAVSQGIDRALERLRGRLADRRAAS